MIRILKTTDNELVELKEIAQNSWVDLRNPSQQEIEYVAKNADIDLDLLSKMLDENELPRVEKSGNATLIVIDAPVLSEDEDDEFVTYPLGIILCKKCLITISVRKVTVLYDFRHNLVNDFDTSKKSRFLIQILSKTAAEYLKILNQIYKNIEKKEDKLEKSTKNEDLLDLLAAQKSLVYFTTSLKENDAVLERLATGKIIKLFNDDSELLEDALIENRQAIDMANIYRGIASNITSTYATVVSNNLNDIMKFLTSVTIVLSIPTMISSFMGMNVGFGTFDDNPLAWLILLVFSIIASLLVYLWLKMKKML